MGNKKLIMKKFIVVLILAIFSIVSVPTVSYAYTKGKSHVKSYKRKDGTRVKAHKTSKYYKGRGGTKKYKRR